MNRDNEEIRDAVRSRYGEIAMKGGGCGCSSSSSCGEPLTPLENHSVGLGYSPDEVKGVPAGSNMGLGCGNPSAIAALKRGEVVLDLGSGGGFDAFLVAKQVGETGRVIGVDMTSEMVSKARDEAKKGGYSNVEFRLGEIENLPAADESVDVIISNCVINLSPEKREVFREAFRVLKPGGRLSVTDIIASAPIPESIRNDLGLVAGCIGGAVTKDDIEEMLHSAGFENIAVVPREESRVFIRQWVPGNNIQEYIVSATIQALKPVRREMRAERMKTIGSALDTHGIKKKAYSHFESGLHCAEVVSKAILEAFSEKPSAEAVRCASGFGGGIVGSMEELCGAFTGGVVTLGYLLGRDNPGESLKDCASLTRQFKSRFLEEFGSIHCPEIIKGFREQKNPLGCVKLTGKATVILADMLKDFSAEKGLDLGSYCSQPREKVELGSCPFSAG